MQSSTYDYIIVGAGSAGCVLAARLSEDPSVQVLLLEAGGPDKRREIRIPAAFSKLFKTQCDWAYYTEKEAQLGDRNLYWPRGKMLGGCSCINAMIYIRGHQSDYDGWALAGNRGWSYEQVLPCFKRSERHHAGESQWHGASGPLHVSKPRCPNPLSELFVQAACESGFLRNPDFNGPGQEGFGLYDVTQENGSRCSTASAFLKPALPRKNLTVRTGIHVFGILFDGRRATSVSFHDGDRTVQARADREILLSAGAVGTPQLLMLSGVGPADHLRNFGMPVVADMPGVGANLQDHPAVPIAWRAKQSVGLADAESAGNLVRYLLFKDGPLTTNVAEAGGFVKITNGVSAPDLQFHFAPGYFVEHGFRRIKEHAFTLGPTLIRPRSRGTIRLRSSNPLDAPAIRANYLQEPEDMKIMLEGVKLARSIGEAKAFVAHREEELLPGKSVATDDALRIHIARYAETLYHPVGTCRMGSDQQAVVDSTLRVHGIEALRVVDASIMPTITGGNTNAPTIMIAEKAAEMIRHGK